MTERPHLTLVRDDPVPRWVRLVWTGDVDASSVRPLAAELRAAWSLDPLLLEVDLAGVTFLDPAGLRPLQAAQARLRHRLRLFDPSPAVTRLLLRLDLADTFLVVGPTDVRAAARLDAVVGASSLLSSVGDRTTTEQARGLLMAVHGCDADAAWDVLTSHARAHGVPVHVMARSLVDHAPDVRSALSQSLVEDVMAERARAAPPEG